MHITKKIVLQIWITRTVSLTHVQLPHKACHIVVFIIHRQKFSGETSLVSNQETFPILKSIKQKIQCFSYQYVPLRNKISNPTVFLTQNDCVGMLADILE